MTEVATGRLIDGLAPRADEDEPLVVVTDEELYVVTAESGGDDRLMPLEVLDRLGEQERALAARTAYRSLLARDLVAPVDDAEVDAARGLVELEVRDPLFSVLDVLSRPWPTVLVANEVDGVTTRRVLLTLGEDLVLEHEARRGFHRFALFGAERAIVELAAFLDPAGAAGEEDAEVLRGPVAAPPTAWRELRSELDAAGTSAHLLAMRGSARTPDRLLVELGTARGSLMMLTPEHADERGEASEVAARRVSRASVLGLAAHALSLEAAVGS